METNKKFSKVVNKQNGITLVALVVTIVILIILATVTINTAFGENGLIKQAQKAKDMASNAVAKENDEINKLEQELANIMGEDGEVTPPNTNEVDPGPVEPTIPDNVEEGKENGTKFEDTTTIKDGQDNDVTIPGDFHIAEDSGTNVEDGIVIEDDAGNQFVWIPVGTYHTTKGDKTNNLSRRIWANSANVVKEPTEVSGDSKITVSIHDFYGEGDSRSPDYQTIKTFKTSATTNSGFYIGRFEQGAENVCKKNVAPYTDLMRDDARRESQSMLSGNSYVSSQLISSYAWDTALNFICQTNTEGYALATTTNSEYGNLGTDSRRNTGMYPQDKYSNIYDMLGNCSEWTSEYLYASLSDPSAARGGCYYPNSYASDRNSYPSTTTDFYKGFRVQLCIK